MTPLRIRMIEDMRTAGLTSGTQAIYLDGVRRLAAYYGRSPDRLSEEEVRAYLIPAYQPICPLCVDGPAGEAGGTCGSAAQRADYAAHVAPVVGGPAEGTEVVGQMLGREHLVGRLQGSAEVGDQGVDDEEWGAPLAFRPLAAGDGGDVGASTLTEDVEGRGAVGVHVRAWGEVRVAERGGLLIGEAADHRQGDRAHATTRMALSRGDDAGLAGGAAARVALAAEVDVVRRHDRRPAALGRCAQLAPIRLFGHRMAKSLVQVPCGRIADAQPAAAFDRRDALLGTAHQVHGAEPGGQRQLGVGHHSARGDRPPHVAARATDPAVIDGALGISATRAWHARLPADLHPRRQTLFFRAVQLLELGVRQPLHDRPHRSDPLLARLDSASISRRA